MSAPILTASDLRKAFGPQVILDGVSISIHEGERLGLVGVNGTGKSTLARILAGAEPADAGSVTTQREAAVMHLEQEPSFDPALTARQVARQGVGAWAAARERHEELTAAISAGGGDVEALITAQSAAAADVERLGGWEMDHRVEALLNRLGVAELDAPVGRLSGGERRRVALARILVARPALAILDEPTNHLDVETIEWLEQYLVDEYPGALLLITHDRYVLDRVVTRTLELDRGAVHSYDGGWEDYLEAKAERLAIEARTEANRQNFLRRELDWLRRSPKARTGKQKARIQRARAAVDSAPTGRRERIAKLDVEAARSGRTVLDVSGMAVEVAGRRLIDKFDLTLRKGDRIGIVGRNGTGKTTLLRTFLGELEPAEGSMVVGKNTRFAYLDQTRSGLDDDASIIDNVADQRRSITVRGRDVDVRSWLEGFLFDPAKQRQKVGALSGGERARVALAKMLLEPANVVLLDEPTNDLDVATLGALEEMLVDMDGTALVVTHDRYFLDRVATAILSFEPDGRVVRYEGSYDTYRRLRAQAEQAVRAARAETEARRDARSGDGQARERGGAGSERPPGRKRKALTYGERLELEGLMDRIDQAEQEVAARQAALADPDLYASRGHEVPERTAELEAARAALEALVARWEELESKQESGG